jgi:hypothetical protein
MDWTTFWIFIHILVMAFWIGGDMGAYYSAGMFVKSEYSPETRAALARVMQGVDMFPRLAMVLIVPTGLTLAARTGLSPIGGGWLALVWVVSAAWLYMVWSVHRPTAPAWGHKLKPVDDAFNYALLIAVAGAVAASIAVAEPFGETWLIVKVALYGLTIIALIVVNFLLRPFVPAFTKLMTEGSSPEVEAVISGSIRKAKPFIWSIWAIVVINTALGLFKPSF